MVQKLVSFLYRHTLASVPFGIIVMVLTALYVAVGSGLPQVREAFEMDEILFFNAWPIRILMILLVLNLAIVTVTRIPFTPPRFGVWMIHTGIVLLIISISAYFSRKTEGFTRVEIGETVSHYYDRWQRALYFRLSNEVARIKPIPMQNLPRFRAHERLDQPELQNLQPNVTTIDTSGQPVTQSLGQMLGLDNPLKIDVVGFHPYAQISRRWQSDVEGGNTGIEIWAPANPARRDFIVAAEPTEAFELLGLAVAEHRHLPTRDDVAWLVAAARQMHKLSVKIGQFEQSLTVEPGQVLPLGDTGYTITIEAFIPDFPLTGTGEPVDFLATRIRTPDGSTFRRMIASGRDVQTDFLPGQGGGPMGKRQTSLVDALIAIRFQHDDTLRLINRGVADEEGTTKYVLITTNDSEAVTLLRVDQTAASTAQAFDAGEGQIDVVGSAPRIGEAARQSTITLAFQRRSGLTLIEQLQPVPPELRVQREGAAGIHQVIKVRVRSGDWSQEYYIPATQFALIGWPQTASIRPPGAQRSFSLILGNLAKPMPMQIRLDRFEAIPYPGGEVSAAMPMRDFVSHLSVTDRQSQLTTEGRARLNEPFFFDAKLPVPLLTESWIVFQSGWDPTQQAFSDLGIGNRPAVVAMFASSTLITIGLLWAFYVKPILIRQAKARALASVPAPTRDTHEPASAL